MCTQVIMPLQTNLATKTGELNSVINAFWPKTPQQNKFKQMMQDKNSNKKRRHLSCGGLNNLSMNKSISTPTTINRSQLQYQQSSPFYAGSKFSEAPLPSFLPKPPTHWIESANLNDLNKLEPIKLNDTHLSSLIETAANVIEESTSILDKSTNSNCSKKSDKSTDKINTNGKLNQSTASSKYYVETNRKSKIEPNAFASSNFHTNFRNTRRNTPQCQTKCKNTRYSSFSRQNIHQKIAAVN